MPARFHQLGLMEMSLGLLPASRAHLEQETSVIRTLPSNKERRLHSLYSPIELAETEANMGEVDEPLALLRSVQEQADGDDMLMRLRFNADIGPLLLRNRDYAEAEARLQGALDIGNGARPTLPETDRLSWARSMGNSYRALVACKIGMGATPRESWALWSSYRAALFDQQSAGATGPEPVAQGEAMLSFAELPFGVVAWLATPGGVQNRLLAKSPKDLQGSANRLVRGCASDRSPVAVLRGDAQELSQWLLGPWDKALDGVRAVVIETDGPVASLPWPALVRSNGHYWSDDFALRIRVGTRPRFEPVVPLSSATTALTVGELRSWITQTCPLPDALSEAEKVSALFARSVSLVGKHRQH